MGLGVESMSGRCSLVKIATSMATHSYRWGGKWGGAAQVCFNSRLLLTSGSRKMTSCDCEGIGEPHDMLAVFTVQFLRKAKRRRVVRQLQASIR